MREIIDNWENEGGALRPRERSEIAPREAHAWTDQAGSARWQQSCPGTGGPAPRPTGPIVEPIA